MKEEKREKINITGKDANHKKIGGSKDILPGYNCQTAVIEAGFIMAAEAVTDANDRNQLNPMVEQTESNTREAVKETAEEWVDLD